MPGAQASRADNHGRASWPESNSGGMKIMDRIRLLPALAFVAVLGTSLAMGQDGTSSFDNQDKKSHRNSKQEKAKSNDSDSHRSHWWSPPHWFHKKHDSPAGTSQSGQAPFDKAGAGDSATTKNQTVKTSDYKTVAAAKTPKTSSIPRSVTGGRPMARTVATTESTGKGATGNSQSKKTVRHDCTPEQTKKDRCAADKGSNQKGTSKPS